MSNDNIRLAFAHPEERAAATAGTPPDDRISLRDHVVEADIGAFHTERGQPQRLRFDVVVEVRAPAAPLNDDVDRILSYDTLTEAISEALGDERINLLETLAERIAERILSEPRAQRCILRIEKLDRGPGALGVEIERAAAPGARRKSEEPAPRPVVVHFANAALSSEHLPAWIDELTGRAAILCVGMPDLPCPETPDPSAQRRVDLLALEQNAWVLAGHAPGCVVTGTRTEIEWALRQGRPVVWAPSKLVLDTEGFAGDLHEEGVLTTWVARLFRAERTLFVGVPPQGTDAESRSADAARLL